MKANRAASQQQIVLRLLSALQPHWRKDRNLPVRIQALFAANRSFGSRDRRLYRETIFTALRYLPWIEPLLKERGPSAVEALAWLSAITPDTQDFRTALVGDWPPCPSGTKAKAAILAERLNLPVPLPDTLPAWFGEHCPEILDASQQETLLSRAPLWLRLQGADDGAALAEFDSRGWTWKRSAILPCAIELQTGVDATKSDAFRKGLFEVQDLGSQLVLAGAAVAPGGRWLDACAGAGGKTLQLSCLLGPSGRIDAHDPRSAALIELRARAQRAGISISGGIESRVTNAPLLDKAPHSTPHTSAAPITIVGEPDGLYDGVLVDAPCSGSGTWRRAPHLKWTTTGGDIVTAARLQGELLHRFSRNVRLGGRLVYATCSLSRRENEDVIAAFLESHCEFSAETSGETFGYPRRGGGLILLPALHNSDGFFFAALRNTKS